MSLPGKFNNIDRASMGSDAPEEGCCSSFCYFVPTFDPSSIWRVVWDVHLIFLLLYIAIFVPYYIGFGSDGRHQYLVVFDMYVDVAFLLDIILSFTTGYIDEETGKLVTRHWRIARSYFYGYFFIDAISGIPWELLPIDASSTTATNILKLTKVSKIFRTMQMLRNAKTAQMRFIGSVVDDFFSLHHNLKRILVTISLVAWMVHVNACFFGLVASDLTSSAGGQEGDGDSWIRDEGLEELSSVKLYINALYWSVTTITTVGYGDIVPVTILEKLYCVVSVAIGAITYGACISTFVAASAASNLKKNQINQKMDGIVLYMQTKKFPKELFQKVYQYFSHFYKTKTAFDESTILNDLNDKLRMEVSSYMAYATFYRNQMFNKIEVKYLTVILLMAKPVRASHDDIVFSAGEKGYEMYIVASGKIRASTDSDEGKHEWIVRKNENIGEPCLFSMDCIRTYTAVACEVTEMLSLSRESVHTTLNSLAPQVVDHLRRLIAYKYKKIARDQKRSSKVAADDNSVAPGKIQNQTKTDTKLSEKMLHAIGLLHVQNAKVTPEPFTSKEDDTASSDPATEPSAATTRGDFAIPEYIGHKTMKAKKRPKIFEEQEESDQSFTAEAAEGRFGGDSGDAAIGPCEMGGSTEDLRQMVSVLTKRNAELEKILTRHIQWQREREKRTQLQLSTIIGCLQSGVAIRGSVGKSAAK
eukprot:g2291.t1